MEVYDVKSVNMLKGGRENKMRESKKTVAVDKCMYSRIRVLPITCWIASSALDKKMQSCVQT